MKSSDEIIEVNPLFKVYDYVWVMSCNKPLKRQVFAVIRSMSYWKQGTELYYNLVGSTMGAGWGNYEGEQYSAEDVFGSKEALLDSLK